MWTELSFLAKLAVYVIYNMLYTNSTWVGETLFIVSDT